MDGAQTVCRPVGQGSRKGGEAKQPKEHPLCYPVFFLCIFGQWLFCEPPQNWSAREPARQFARMLQKDARSQERTAVAFRLIEPLDADGFPSSSSWELSAPLRFNTDWQGKNADPGRETEVRLLWTPE